MNEVSAFRLNAGSQLVEVLDHPSVVLGALDATAASQVGQLLLAADVRYDAGVDAEELPLEDPTALARAIDRVARGEVVHLVRDGRPVADLVPAGVDSPTAHAQHVARAVTQRMADRFGAPTLAHYRRVYESCGQTWPGDEEIRRRFPVADAS